MAEALTVATLVLAYSAILWRLHVWETKRINRRIVQKRLIQLTTERRAQC